MIEIKIPFKTPTVNHLYGQRGFHKFLTKEARDLREEIKAIVCEYYNEGFSLNLSNIEVTVEIYENWYNKDGSVKRKDIANREKFLIDSIFNELGIDDKAIFKHTMIKRQSDKEYAMVTIK